MLRTQDYVENLESMNPIEDAIASFNKKAAHVGHAELAAEARSGLEEQLRTKWEVGRLGFTATL